MRGGEGTSTIGDDGAGGRDLELLGDELGHRGEGRLLQHAEPAKSQSEGGSAP